MSDFSITTIRCSSLGCLFTEPQSKADKEAGKLSKTAQSHLIEVYAQEYGYEKDVLTKQMKKGIIAEEEGISLVSRLDKQFYTKNEERKTNEWVSGHADIVTESKIIDIKLSWDIFTFLPKLMEDVDKGYFYQLQGYLWLWDLQEAEIAYCLVNTPDNIIEGEKYRLLRSMDVISEESPEFLREAAKLERNMKFDQFPIEQRVIRHKVIRNDEVIAKIPEKVERAREFLEELHERHLSVNQYLNIAV